MKVLSIRRVTNDRRHNAFTGACWFHGDLFVAYRQGDGHVDATGRVVVLRSRDKGVTWDTVAAVRGPHDTRDGSLYTDGSRLYAVSFTSSSTGVGRSGCAVTDDGDRWTSWRAYEGTGNAVLWRPAYFNGKHYCAGYQYSRPYSVHWFESTDGLNWRDIRPVLESDTEEPNECYLEISPEGVAVMLMRCERAGKHPYLCRSTAPFATWEMQRLEDIVLLGPAVWTVEGSVYIGGRWFIPDSELFDEGCGASHTAIFKVVDGKTHLQCVLPSGPRPDHSYMGVARWPDNRRRFSISFYSNAVAPDDPALVQWDKPDIYLADILYGAEFIQEMLVSDLVETEDGLSAAVVPDPAAGKLRFRTVHAEKNFLNVRDAIKDRRGIVYFVKDIEVGPWDSIDLHLGYDGPVRVWLNGQEVFQGRAATPAREDTTSLRLVSRHGRNRLTVALDTDGGKAWGIFARWEPA